MIKINLVKEKKEKGKAFDLSALKGVKVQDLLKAGAEYYLGIVAWIALIPVGGYYWKLTKERDALKFELDRLNAEKARLQARANEMLKQKKELENTIANIKKQIQDIENSKNIMIGLKAYYEQFIIGLNFYSSRVPKTAWLNSYRQNLDINQQVLKSEFDINALDYESLTSYGNLLNASIGKVSMSQLEKKTTPNGYEYYSAKLSTERPILFNAGR